MPTRNRDATRRPHASRERTAPPPARSPRTPPDDARAGTRPGGRPAEDGTDELLGEPSDYVIPRDAT